MAKMNKLFLREYEAAKFEHFRKTKVFDSPATIARRKALKSYVTELERAQFIDQKTCNLRLRTQYGCSVEEVNEYNLKFII